MVLAIVVAVLTCLGIIITSILKPSIKIKRVNINLYWVIALVGAIIILASLTLTWSEFTKGLVGNDKMNPIQILILFISMTIISIFLDELGFFSLAANFVLKHTKSKQIPIFIAFYILIAVLTMFTSNDIIILTLTPFIIFFCKRSNISPIPYLVSEFICANTWSMMFVIGNPTNIYLSQSFGISFLDYFKVMAVPTLLAGIVEFAILFLVFHKKLKEQIIKEEITLEFNNKFLTIFALVILLGCTVMLIISSYISIKMYIIAAISLGVLLVGASIYYIVKKEKPTEILHSLRRAPWELIPFVIAMFTIVLALNKYEVTKNLALFFGSNHLNYVYGYSSLLAANLFNNIPMSVFYSGIITYIPGGNINHAIYSSIAGSNIGAFLTPIGALAGIMWLGILKKHDVKFSFLDFAKYGLLVGIPVITVTISAILLFV